MTCFIPLAIADVKSSEVVQQVKASGTKTDSRISVPRTKQWKKKTDPHKVFSDFCMPTLAHGK